MHTKFRVFVVCTMLALACAAWVVASGGTVEVTIQDAQGQTLTSGELLVYTEGGSVLKVVPRGDGVFEFNAAVGDKLEMFYGNETLGQAHKFSSVVPASETILHQMEGVAPSNDDCAGAIPVAVPSVTAGSTIGATFDGAPTCGTTNTQPGVWYTVVGTGNEMTASTCPDNGGSADYDTKLSVFCADCDPGVCVGGNDDSCSSDFLKSTVTWCSQAGATYNILVHGYSGTGNFNLSVYESGGACEATVECLPTGACCTCLNPPFDCSVIPQEECLALGGLPRGPGTGCTTPVPGSEIDYVAYPGTVIPDGDGIGITETITVAESISIDDVNIDIGITHTWIGDLVITVEHLGTEAILWNRVCSSSDDLNATADDSGTETLCSVVGGGPIDSVFYSPVDAGGDPLGVFTGMDSAGDWNLTVADFVGVDGGTLDQWSVHISETNPTCELNVTLCHNGNTIVVGQTSVPAHLDHGDSLGPCGGGGGGGDGSFGRNP